MATRQDPATTRAASSRVGSAARSPSTLLGARYGHRQLLLGVASLMIATGIAFALVHDYALLLVVALAGTINPSAGSVSVFVPLEHAALTALVRDTQRTRMFARYSIESCRRCGGKLRVIASIEEQEVIDRILDHLGRDDEPVDPAHPTRAPPPGELAI